MANAGAYDSDASDVALSAESDMRATLARCATSGKLVLLTEGGVADVEVTSASRASTDDNDDQESKAARRLAVELRATSLNVSLSDLPGYEEQHALLLNAYFVINDEPESVLLADEVMERRPSTRAGANVILYRPSGTGKTAAARAVARSLGSNLAFVNAENLLSTYRLETKKKLRSLYRKMRALVRTTGRNVLLLLDEVDGLVKNRSGALTSGEYSLLTRFLTILEPNDGTDNYGVFSIFTTNRLSNLDDAFRRRCAAVFMGYVGYVGTREATVRLFNAFLHRPIDYATRGTRFASRDYESKIRRICRHWVPGDFARFKRTIGKPSRLRRYFERSDTTYEDFVTERLATRGDDAVDDGRDDREIA
ncbi:vacuolar protein sorting-associated protein 4-like [Harpegnathos saltator]|uniref:vacuolar protein sorting-associated protein 4-like n=1 Tax=Harpegnathos saltator TaxID=610380 RepID=UPI000DBEE570|nr:vacuolar protein sorting-associated protein 4-like [Harpegnathos saltator]